MGEFRQELIPTRRGRGGGYVVFENSSCLRVRERMEPRVNGINLGSNQISPEIGFPLEGCVCVKL